RAEWAAFEPGQAYRKTCPQWPVHGWLDGLCPASSPRGRPHAAAGGGDLEGPAEDLGGLGGPRLRQHDLRRGPSRSQGGGSTSWTSWPTGGAWTRTTTP